MRVTTAGRKIETAGLEASERGETGVRGIATAGWRTWRLERDGGGVLMEDGIFAGAAGAQWRQGCRARARVVV